MINEARYNNAKVIVCGCHVQAKPEEEFDYDNIYLCGNQNKADFVKKVIEGRAEKKRIEQEQEPSVYSDIRCVSISKRDSPVLPQKSCT